MTRTQLVDFLKEFLELPQLNRMIESQITRFMQSGYTAKNIARSVFYYVDIRNNKFDSQYGIGIVPHIHDEAVKYYNMLIAKENHYATQNKILLELLKEEKETIVANPKFGRRGVNKIDISSIGKKEVE